jgi:uncharacterized protein (DUF58 family)
MSELKDERLAAKRKVDGAAGQMASGERDGGGVMRKRKAAKKYDARVNGKSVIAGISGDGSLQQQQQQKGRWKRQRQRQLQQHHQHQQRKQQKQQYQQQQKQQKYQQGQLQLRRDFGYSINRHYRTRWGALAFIAAGLLLSAAAIIIRGGAAEWFMAVLLGTIMLSSYIVPLIALQGVAVERSLSAVELAGGGRMEVRLSFRRRWAIPLVWLMLRDEFVNEKSIYAPSASFQWVMLPAFKRSWLAGYRLETMRRGRYQASEVVVTAGDWLGLAAFSKKLSCPASFLVFPVLPTQEAGNHFNVNSRSGMSVQKTPVLAGRGAKAKDDGSSVAGQAEGSGSDTRPYREGDSLRYVDWRGAARGRGWHTRLDAVANRPVVVIAVDTAAAVTDAEEEQLFEAAVGWAALAVNQAQEDGCEVKLLAATAAGSAGSPAIRDLTSESSRSMLRELACLRTTGAGAAAGKAKGTVIAKLIAMTKAIAAGKPTGARKEEAERSNAGAGESKGATEMGNVKESGLGQWASVMRGGEMSVFTTDWRAGDRWERLAGQVSRRGIRLQLYIATRVPTLGFAMREQQKRLETAGVKVKWLNAPKEPGETARAADGGNADDQVQI